MSNAPWWWPERATQETVKRLRKDYPEKSSEYEDDESFMDYFEYTLGKFMDTWDHLGDARDQFNDLADAFLKLVDECGKTPSDFSKTPTQEIAYKKRTGYEIECRNCSYKIIVEDEPSDGDEVTCDNCKSQYIITDE